MLINYEMQLIGNLKELIQSKIYEKMIFDLMKASSRIFPGVYEQHENQANSECDFYDVNTNSKYEAKLIFTNEQCQTIAKSGGRDIEWLKSILQEIREVSKIFLSKKPPYHDLSDTLLYKTIKDRLETVNDDENAILFIPFPIVDSFESSIYGQFATDIMGIIYERLLLENELNLSNKKIYLIYPNSEQKFVLRELGSYKKEFIKIKNDYIEYFSYL